MARALERALGPLSRTEAERLLRTMPKRPASDAHELLGGRCLRLVESFQAAWSTLVAVAERAADARIRARANVELVFLSYYLVRHDEGERAAAAADEDAAADPLTLADLHVARSILATGADRIPDAFKQIAFAQDALRGAGRGRGRDLVEAALQRQLAHLHVHAASYADARAAARAVQRIATRLRDPWERRWATYTQGFTEWAAGDLDRARISLATAERDLRASGSSLWRWTLFCLATVEAELGLSSRTITQAQTSGYGTRSGLAYLALRAGDASAAVDRLGARVDGEDIETTAVRGLVLCERGERADGVRGLEDARVRSGTAGLLSDALACAIHAGYWQERSRRGSGATSARKAMEELLAGGGEGLRWYDARVAAWVAPLVRRADPVAAERIARRAAAILARAAPAGAPGRFPGVRALRARGLTEREAEIVSALRPGAADREELARRLGMSPNTLRVHLTRIRSKLGVGTGRGDAAILAALGARAPS